MRRAAPAAQNSSAPWAMTVPLPAMILRKSPAVSGRYLLHVEAGGLELGVVEGVAVLLVAGELRHLAPHVAHRHQTEHPEIVRGRRAGFLGIAKTPLGDDECRGLQLAERLAHRYHDVGELRVVLVGLDEGDGGVEEVPQIAAGPLGQLAAHQIERLDAVRALVDLGNPRIPHELLHPVFADVAVAAVDLDGEVRGLEAVVGEEGLDDRRHELHQLVGILAHRGVLVAARDVELQRRPVGERAGTLVDGTLGEQHAAHVGVDDDRVGGRLRLFGALEPAPLAAVLGVGGGALIGGLAQSQALEADAEAGAVHHREHAAQPLVRRADQVALSLLEVHHAGRRPVDAHLLLDGAAGDTVGRPRAAVGE